MHFSLEFADSFCERIASGDSVRSICSDNNMPSMSTVFRWLAEDSKFQERYARAKEAALECMADELLDIADDARNDWMDKRFGEEVVRVQDQEVLQRSRLRVDTRKWLLSKLAPKKYGERLVQQHEGEIGIKSILVPERISTVRSVNPLSPDFGE